jgi:peroxiredoxin
VQLHRARSQFDTAGVGLTLIGQATPKDAADFRRRMKIDLTVLADEDRTTYKAFGLKVGTVGELVGPKMLVKGMLASARFGVVQGKTVGHVAQLGGAAVILPGDRIVLEHRAKDASDNVSPDVLLAAAQRAA